MVVGPALGKLKALFGKIQVINTKNGPFDFALCLGDLFDGEDTQEVDDLLAGRIAVPIQCYCVMGGKRLPPKVIEQVERNHGEIAENLVFLGRSTSVLSCPAPGLLPLISLWRRKTRSLRFHDFVVCFRNLWLSGLACLHTSRLLSLLQLDW